MIRRHRKPDDTASTFYLAVPGGVRTTEVGDRCHDLM
jgi:hypothetical protein